MNSTEYLFSCSPVSWVYRIHRLHLCRSIRSPPNEYPGYDIKTFSELRRSKDRNDACFGFLKALNFLGVGSSTCEWFLGGGGYLGWCLGFIRWQWDEQKDLREKRHQYREGKVPQRNMSLISEQIEGVLKGKTRERNTILEKNCSFWRQMEICAYTEKRVYYKHSVRIYELEETEKERWDEKR